MCCSGGYLFIRMARISARPGDWDWDWDTFWIFRFSCWMRVGIVIPPFFFLWIMGGSLVHED